MSDTKTNRRYAWGLQADFQTLKPIAAGAFKQILCTDDNTIDYELKTSTDEEWAHGYNYATDEWPESHDAKVSHTIPGHSQELGKVFFLNLGNYAISTPTAGVLAKTHTFKPTNPDVTRQDRAVTYVEKMAFVGWHKMMADAVSDGFTLKGDGTGVLMCDFNLMGSGKVINDPAVTYSPTASPSVADLTGLNKFFNTQFDIFPSDGGAIAGNFGCRYRSFQIAFKKTMLSEAGYKPGCQRFFVPTDPTSGIIRSAHEFDKQMLDFNFNVDMGEDSNSFKAVQDNRPIQLRISGTGGIIEGTIRHKLDIIIGVTKYNTTKPTLVNNIWNFGISGKAFLDKTQNNLFSIELTNNVPSYLTAF